MIILQMNWRRLKYSRQDKRMTEFYESLSKVYVLAEKYPEFTWSILDGQFESQLYDLRFDNLISSTVSIWTDIELFAQLKYLHDNGPSEYAYGWKNK